MPARPAGQSPRTTHRSPPTARVVRLLNHLAAHPASRFGLSELGRLIEVNKATCLAILNELAASGYVTRDRERKSYALGPGLLPVARAAQTGHGAIELARPHLLNLAAATGLECTAATVAGEHILVLDRFGSHRPGDLTVRPGQRFPLAPPWSLVHIVWYDDDAIAEWKARPPLFPVTVDAAELAHVTAAARRSSCLIELSTDYAVQVNALFARLAGEPVSRPLLDGIAKMIAATGYRRFLTEEPKTAQRIGMFVAPVYNRAAQPELIVTLIGHNTPMKPAEVKRVRDALLATVRDLTDLIGGRNPWQGDTPKRRR